MIASNSSNNDSRFNEIFEYYSVLRNAYNITSYIILYIYSLDIENVEKKDDIKINISENSTRSIVTDRNKLAQWDSFVQGTLHMILDHHLISHH